MAGSDMFTQALYGTTSSNSCWNWAKQENHWNSIKLVYTNYPMTPTSAPTPPEEEFPAPKGSLAWLDGRVSEMRVRL